MLRDTYGLSAEMWMIFCFFFPRFYSVPVLWYVIAKLKNPAFQASRPTSLLPFGFLLFILRRLIQLDHIRTMSSFIRVFAFLVLNSILAHARPQDLFTLDSPQFNLDAPYNDASSLLNSNDVTSDSTSLFLDPLDQGIDFSSDMDSFGNSNNLFASNSMDLTALPSCKSEGSQTDSSLQARDGSCQPQETINLPTELFQDPFKFLRDNIGTPLRGQIRRPGQGDQKDENTNLIFFTSPFKDDEEACPTYFFGPSNIPVCQNPLTGHAEREVASNAKRLYNIISCQCRVTHFALFVKLLAIADPLARRSSDLSSFFKTFMLRDSDKQSELILRHYFSMALFDPV